MSSNKIKLSNQNGDLRFREMVWVWIPPIWRAVLSLFYPPVIIRGKNGKNSENPVGSNKSEKRKPKSAVYRSFWASVVYFHLRLISTKSHKREMTRNRLAGVEPTRGFESHALRHRSYQPRLVASFLYPEMEIAFHCACRCELWWVIKVRVDICCGWKIAMS